MSVNTPEEVSSTKVCTPYAYGNAVFQGLAKRVEWIKNLVLSLINKKKKAPGGIAAPNTSLVETEDDPIYTSNFKLMITVVLESIEIVRKQLEENEGEEESSTQSVATDLHLLQCLLQSKV